MVDEMLKSAKISYLLMFLIPIVVSIVVYENGIDFLLSVLACTSEHALGIYPILQVFLLFMMSH